MTPLRAVALPMLSRKVRRITASCHRCSVSLMDEMVPPPPEVPPLLAAQTQPPPQSLLAALEMYLAKCR